MYRKNSKQRPASFKCPHPISAGGKFQKLNKCPYPISATCKRGGGGGGALARNIWYYLNMLAWQLKVIWCYLLLYKSFLLYLKKNNAKVTCLLHKSACKNCGSTGILHEFISRRTYSNFYGNHFRLTQKTAINIRQCVNIIFQEEPLFKKLSPDLLQLQL